MVYTLYKENTPNYMKMWRISELTIFKLCSAVTLVLLGITYFEVRKNALKHKMENTRSIQIASVICSIPGDTEPIREAAVMIKSVIISAKMYSVQRITFHFIVEHTNDGNYLWRKLKEYGHPFTDVEVFLFSYDIRLVIPPPYHGLMFRDVKLRCMFARHFLPRILSQLDAVLYFDIDFIVMGNVSRYWDLFDEMSPKEIIGITVDNEPTCPFDSPYYTVIPYLKPKGLSSGMLAMNLTRMREFNWEEKYFRLFKDYSKILKEPMNDQQVLNIFMYYGTGAMKLISCQYQFWWVYCMYTNPMCCPAVYEDPQGILAVAGASETFDPHREFRELFLAYENLNMTNPNLDFRKNLMIPLRSVYSAPTTAKLNKSSERLGKAGKCDGQIDKFIFKDQFI